MPPTRLPVTVHASFGGDDLVVRSVHGTEAVSEPFAYTVELESGNGALPLQSAVGTAMSICVKRTRVGPRWIHGIVTRFAQTPGTLGTARYRAELRPWLWLLTLRADCRIFQGDRATVPAILETLFAGQSFESALKLKYAPREFCVQYRETAFDFASRLMEEEGISYFFRHGQDGHTLVLVDEPKGFEPCPDLPAANLRPGATDEELDDAVTACTLEHAAATDRVLLDDYNFQLPATPLLASSAGDPTAPSPVSPAPATPLPASSAAGPTVPNVVFDYPGRYTAKADGERLARLRWEARTAGVSRLLGRGTCRGFVAGHRFTLAGHERADANTDYVLRALTLRVDQDRYANEFDAFPAGTAFRPEPRTPRPVIAGTQTAVVVGKEGEEIWTESYGRVKVKFHWDHRGPTNENSSCWVRVAQGWAGKGWGSVVLPRVGQEVVVTFLDGNPDRPLVTGCVYNAAHTPPYALPGAQTRSTFHSSSSPGGAAYNEIRFEDKKDEEEVCLHAGRDLTVDVVHNRAATVQTGNDTLAVKKGARTVTIAEGNDTLTVGKGTRSVTVQGDETHTNHAAFTQTTGGDYVLNVTGNLVIKATGSITLQAGTSLTAQSGTSLQATAGTTFTASGAISTNVSSNGTTSVTGQLVEVNG